VTDLGTFQIRFPDFEISYPEPQFRADALPLRDELRAKFLAGMADVYDRYAEKARQRYNEIDPETDRPAIERNGFMTVALTASGGDGIALRSTAPQDGADREEASLEADREKETPMTETKDATPNQLTGPIDTIRQREMEHQRQHDTPSLAMESCLPGGCSPDQGDIPTLIRMVDALTDKLRIEREYLSKAVTMLTDSPSLDARSLADQIVMLECMSGPDNEPLPPVRNVVLHFSADLDRDAWSLVKVPSSDTSCSSGSDSPYPAIHLKLESGWRGKKWMLSSPERIPSCDMPRINAEDHRINAAGETLAEFANATGAIGCVSPGSAAAIPDSAFFVVPDAIETFHGTLRMEVGEPVDPRLMTTEELLALGSAEPTMTELAAPGEPLEAIALEHTEAMGDRINDGVSVILGESVATPLWTGPKDGSALTGGGPAMTPPKRSAGRPRNCPNAKTCKGRLKSAMDKEFGICRKCRKAAKGAAPAS
jgi:hypothetical protein